MKTYFKKISKNLAFVFNILFNLLLVFLLGTFLKDSMYINENSIWLELKKIDYNPLLSYLFALITIFAIGYLLFFFIATEILKKTPDKNPNLFYIAARMTFIPPICLFFVFGVSKDLFILVSSIVSFSALYNIFFRIKTSHSPGSKQINRNDEY